MKKIIIAFLLLYILCLNNYIFSNQKNNILYTNNIFQFKNKINLSNHNNFSQKSTYNSKNLFLDKYYNLLAENYSDKEEKKKFKIKKRKEKEFKEIVFRDIDYKSWWKEENRLERLFIGASAVSFAIGFGMFLAGLLNYYVTFNAVSIDDERLTTQSNLSLSLIGVGAGLQGAGIPFLLVGTIKIGVKKLKAKKNSQEKNNKESDKKSENTEAKEKK